MKIAFYTLPKVERRMISDTIEELTANINRFKDEHQRHLNQAERAAAMLNLKKAQLDGIKEKYSFD